MVTARVDTAADIAAAADSAAAVVFVEAGGAVSFEVC
jgi:hypothetical protein